MHTPLNLWIKSQKLLTSKFSFQVAVPVLEQKPWIPVLELSILITGLWQIDLAEIVIGKYLLEALKE